jgi:hypothetical protein
VGDYGDWNRRTNELQRRGNIFKDEEILALNPELATDDAWKPRQTSELDKVIITTCSRMVDVGPSGCVIK